MEKALQQILQELNDLRANQVIMSTQLGEHGKILSSLQTSAEFHKADNDNLVHQTANLSGEIRMSSP